MNTTATLTSTPTIEHPLLNFTNTPGTYLTGLVALNLSAPEGTAGDWHRIGIFYPGNEQTLRDFQSGGTLFPSTKDLFENDGIYECSRQIKQEYGLETTGHAYAANHFRAIIDLVITCYKNGETPAPVPFIDYISTKKHQKIFINFLNKRAENFPKELRNAFASWLKNNKRIEKLKWS